VRAAVTQLGSAGYKALSFGTRHGDASVRRDISRFVSLQRPAEPTRCEVEVAQLEAGV
jgi:hypothetical protein